MRDFFEQPLAYYQVKLGKAILLGVFYYIQRLICGENHI